LYSTVKESQAYSSLAIIVGRFKRSVHCVPVCYACTNELWRRTTQKTMVNDQWHFFMSTSYVPVSVCVHGWNSDGRSI